MNTVLNSAQLSDILHNAGQSVNQMNAGGLKRAIHAIQENDGWEKDPASRSLITFFDSVIQSVLLLNEYDSEYGPNNY